MTKKEIVNLIESYGYSLYTESCGEDSSIRLVFQPANIIARAMNHQVVTNVEIEYDANTDAKQFRFIYVTRRGALKLSTGWCSPFDHEEHFRRHEKVHREFANQLYMYEEATRNGF